MPNAPIVAPGICRFTIHGQYAGQEIANVLDIDIDSDAGTDRDNNIVDQAEIIVSAWVTHICPNLSNTYQADEVSWLDLNALDGSVGVTTTGTGPDFPQVGGVGGNPMPGSISYMVTKNVAAKRGARKGRMFLVGVPESVTSSLEPNLVLSATVIALNTALAQFLADVNQNGGAYGSHLKVLHTKNNGTPEDPIIIYNGQSEVTSLIASSKIHSQRRRLP